MGFAPIPRLSQSRMLTVTLWSPLGNWFLRWATIPHGQSKNLLCCQVHHEGIWKWRLIRVTLPCWLIDNQLCYYYNNEPKRYGGRPGVEPCPLVLQTSALPRELDGLRNDWQRVENVSSSYELSI